MTITPLAVFHISAGTIGLLSGAAAFIFRKGSVRHRTAGKVFIISMISMAASASVLAYLLQDLTRVLGGITTIYVVVTAWMTLRRKQGETGRFEIVAFLVAVVAITAYLAFGLEATNNATGLVDGHPAGFHYFYAALTAVFAAGDLRLILRGGISGAQRIARHLWRMCYAVFVAAGSLFLGQMQIFPEFIQDTNVLFVLPFVPLVLMIFWLKKSA